MIFLTIDSFKSFTLRFFLLCSSQFQKILATEIHINLILFNKYFSSFFPSFFFWLTKSTTVVFAVALHTNCSKFFTREKITWKTYRKTLWTPIQVHVGANMFVFNTCTKATRVEAEQWNQPRADNVRKAR